MVGKKMKQILVTAFDIRFFFLGIVSQGASFFIFQAESFIFSWGNTKWGGSYSGGRPIYAPAKESPGSYTVKRFKAAILRTSPKKLLLSGKNRTSVLEILCQKLSLKLIKHCRNSVNIIWSEVYSEPCQISKMEHFYGNS